MVEMDGFVVLIDAEEGDVEIVSWVGEVVGVAAEESDTEFRRKNKANVGVLFVLVEVVDFAGVERHCVATQASCCRAIFFYGAHGGALRLSGFGGGHALGGGGFD